MYCNIFQSGAQSVTIATVCSSEHDHMANIAQLVRATVCGTVGRGFETHYSPQNYDKMTDL